LELLEAERRKVPIVPVLISTKGFDLAAMRQYIDNLEQRMGCENPSGLVLLVEQVGQDLSELKAAVSAVLDMIDRTSMRPLAWNSGADDEEVEAAAKDIIERMAHVTDRQLEWSGGFEEEHAEQTRAREPSWSRGVFDWLLRRRDARPPLALIVSHSTSVADARVLQTGIAKVALRRVLVSAPRRRNRHGLAGALGEAAGHLAQEIDHFLPSRPSLCAPERSVTLPPRQPPMHPRRLPSSAAVAALQLCDQAIATMEQAQATEQPSAGQSSVRFAASARPALSSPPPRPSAADRSVSDSSFAPSSLGEASVGQRHVHLVTAPDECEVVIVLLTEHLLTEPRILFCLWHAMQGDKLVVPVYCERRGYSFASAQTFLADLEHSLPPDAYAELLALVEAEGYSDAVDAVGTLQAELHATLPSLIAVAFDPEGGANQLAAVVRKIMNKVRAASRARDSSAARDSTSARARYRDAYQAGRRGSRPARGGSTNLSTTGAESSSEVQGVAVGSATPQETTWRPSVMVSVANASAAFASRVRQRTASGGGSTTTAPAAELAATPAATPSSADERQATTPAAAGRELQHERV
jgi:hypothetical protein